MSNPLFNALGGGNLPMNNPFQIINQFMQFKNSFKGNPQEEVQKLINSGKFTQKQIDQAQDMARTFQSMLGMK